MTASATGILREARRVLVLTGAGVSAESGVPTFRGPDGLWKSHRPENLATPEAFRRDPALVWEWYGWRREKVGACEPNPAHRALARLALARPGVTLVTQNVDGLHELAAVEEAGARGLPSPEPALPLALHGSLFRVRCTGCPERYGHREPVDGTDASTLPRCRSCGALLRPDVVWFGESLPEDVLLGAVRAADQADVCLVVGTSAVVQPAAGLPLRTMGAGGVVVEVNPEATPLSDRAEFVLRAPAGRVLPGIVEEAVEG